MGDIFLSVCTRSIVVFALQLHGRQISNCWLAGCSLFLQIMLSVKTLVVNSHYIESQFGKNNDVVNMAKVVAVMLVAAVIVIGASCLSIG